MFHDLQKRNHTAMFNLIDSNKDGVLTWDDHQALLDRFAAATNLSADSPEYAGLRGAIQRNWQELKKQADTNKDDIVTRDEWLAHNERMMATKEGYAIAIESISQMLLGLADDDRDGKLTPANYTMLLGCYGVDAASAAKAFQAVDQNKDGIVSVDELMKAVEQFVSSDNPNDPGHWLIGPPA